MTTSYGVSLGWRWRLLRSLYRSTSPGQRGVSWWDVSELGLVALGFLLYFLVRGAVADRTAEALANARSIVELERALLVFIEPTVNRWTLDHELVWRVMNFVYFWLDFPLIVGAGLLLFWKRRHWYTLLRDSLLASGGLALVLYWSFPVAPPRFLPEWGFVDTMQVHAQLSYQMQSLQPFVNPFAAVPSLHVGWAALFVYAVFGATGSPLLRGSAVLVMLLQWLSVVATANHYLFDGVVGLLVAAAGLGLALTLQRLAYPAVHRQVALWARSAEAPRPSAEPPSA